MAKEDISREEIRKLAIPIFIKYKILELLGFVAICFITYWNGKYIDKWLGGNGETIIIVSIGLMGDFVLFMVGLIIFLIVEKNWDMAIEKAKEKIENG